jgi:hypothetical protein
MSSYALGRLFFDANRDRDLVLVKRYQEDPESVLAEYDLTEAEREAVRNRDIRTIYEEGLHPLLVRIGGLALLGVRDIDEYRAAIAGATQKND